MTDILTPSGYTQTTTDVLEWNYLWDEILNKSSFPFSNLKPYFTTD